MLEFFEVAVDNGTARGCAQCVAGSRTPHPVHESRSAAAVVDDAGVIAASWDSGSGPNILLAGVDPLGHPELLSIVSGMRSAGARLGVATGQVQVVAVSHARDIVQAGLRHFHVSLLGDEPTHDTLAGFDGAFGLQIGFMHAVRAAAADGGRRVCLVGRIPVCVHNLKAASWAVGALIGATADWVVLDLAENLDPRTAAAWIASAVETGASNGRWVAVEGRDPSAFGVSEIASRGPVIIRGAVQ